MSEARIAENMLCMLVFWVIIWVSARLAEVTRLSPLLFYLLFGCITGNVYVAAMDLHESAFLQTFAVLAIAIVFFALGLEESVGHFISGLKMAWGIANIGAFVPFGAGYAAMAVLYPEAGYKLAMMGGLAVTATAVSLTMIALKMEGLMGTKAAMGIMTAAVLDDIGSLAFVAICVPIATGEGSVSALGIVWVMSKAVLFFVLVAFVHKIILPMEATGFAEKFACCVNKFGIQQVFKWKNGEQAILASLVYGMLWMVTAHLFGFHPAIGAYMGGLILEEQYFDLPNDESGVKRNTFHEVFHHIETVAYGWMGPFFFIVLAANIELDMELLTKVILKVLGFFVVLFLAQFFSAALAAKYVPGGFSWAESTLIGLGMMGRAELFFVVLDLCYTEHHIMNREQMVVFALTGMLMNISVPVTIALYKPYYCRMTGYDWKAQLEKEKNRDPHGQDAHKEVGDEHDAGDDEDGHDTEKGEKHSKADRKSFDSHSRKKAIDDDLDGIEVETTIEEEDEEVEDYESENYAKKRKKRNSIMPMLCGCMTAQGDPTDFSKHHLHESGSR